MRPTEFLEFRTDDIDLAAALMVATKERPAVYPGEELVIFGFTSSASVMETVEVYASGRLMQPVKKFASARGFLYRQAREVVRTGGAR